MCTDFDLRMEIGAALAMTGGAVIGAHGRRTAHELLDQHRIDRMPQILLPAHPRHSNPEPPHPPFHRHLIHNFQNVNRT